MPQVILLAALGAGLYAGMRALVRIGEQFAGDLKRNAEAVRQGAGARAPVGQKDGGTLEYDAASGVYRPIVR